MTDKDKIEKLEKELNETKLLLSNMILKYEEKMNKESIDKWLKDNEGMSYTELTKEFNSAVELLGKFTNRVHNTYQAIQYLRNKNAISHLNANILEQALRNERSDK